MTSRKPSRHRTTRDFGRQAGLSLVETAIYFSILAVLGSSLSAMTLGVSRTSAEGKMLGEITERNRVAIRRVKEGYRRALSSTVAVTNNSRTLTFNLPGGFNGTGATVGDSVSFVIAADPLDTPNSLDDDGDGLIDEGVLNLVNNTTGTTTTISHSVDYGTSRFVNLGWGLFLQMDHVGVTKESSKFTKISKTLYLIPRN